MKKIPDVNLEEGVNAEFTQNTTDLYVPAAAITAEASVYTLDTEEAELPLLFALEASAYTVTVTIACGDETGTVTKMYDGSSLKAEDALIRIKKEDASDSVTAVSTHNEITEVGSTTSVTSVTVNRGGTDVTSHYEITKNEITLVITARDVVLTSSDASFEYDGTVHSFEEVTEGGSRFVEGQGASYSNFASITYFGTETNTFDYTLNDGTSAGNYDIEKEFGTLTVTKRQSNVKLIVDPITKMYDGTTAIDQSAISWSSETVVGKEIVSGDTVSFTVSTERVDAGNGVVEVSDRKMTNSNGRDVTDCYTWDGVVSGGITILKRDVVLTSNGGSWEYDGTAHSIEGITVSGSNFVEGQGVSSYSNYASITYVGTKDNTFDYTLDTATTKAENYDIQKVCGTLEVTARASEIAITVNALEKLYDGNSNITLTADDWSYTTAEGKGLVAGDTLSISIVNSNIDAGSYTTGYSVVYKITNASGADVTANYTFGDITLNGLTINKRNVTLTSASDQKTYDGTPLTNRTVTVSGDGFVDGQGASYTVTGSQTTAGTSSNTFTYDLYTNTKAENYNITKVEGELRVDAYEGNVVITVDAFERMYNGGTLFTLDSGYSVTGLFAGDHIDSISVTAVDADVAQNKSYTVSYQILNSAGVDVTGAYGNQSTVLGQFDITKRDVVLTSSDASFEYDGTAHSFEEVAESGSGFVEGQGATYSNYATITYAGTEDNTFDYTLNDGTAAGNYDITKESGTLTVTKRQTNIKIVVDPITKMYDGTTVIDQSSITWSHSEDKALVEGDTISFDVSTGLVDAGTGTIEVTNRKMTNSIGQDVTGCYTWDGINTGGIAILKRDVVMTSSNATWEYDGTAHSVEGITVSGSNFVEGQGVSSYSNYASITYVGTKDNTFDYTLDTATTKAGNYDIQKVYGTLEVTARASEIAITVNALEKLYDGTGDITLTADDWSYTTAEGKGLVAGDTLSISIVNSNIDAGTYTTGFSVVYKITNASGDDVTDNYTFGDITLNGLTINKRNVTLTSGSASKAYDGTPLTCNTVTVSGDGFVHGQGVTYTVTGSQTEVGSSPNTFSYELKANTKAENYNITKVEGTLEVTGYAEPVTLTVNAFQRVYNGEYLFTLEDSEYSVEGLRANDHLGTITVTAEDANAGSNKNYTVSFRIYNRDGEDVTGDYTNIQDPVLGQFDILKRGITVTAGSASKVYDNTALTCDTYTVSDDLIEGDYVEPVAITGSATHVSESVAGNNQVGNVVIKNADGDDVTANYEITKVNGNLVITQRTATLVSGSASKVYDGTPLTLHKVTQSGYLDGDGANYWVSGIQDEVGTSANTFTWNFSSQIGSEESDYLFVTEYGTLEVTQPDPIALTIIADSACKVYDGTALTCSGYTLAEGALLLGDELVVTVEGSITNAGTAANNVISVQVMRGTTDVTSWYDIDTEAGVLAVSKRDLYLTSGTAQKEYDGTPLTDDHITEEGFVDGEGAIYHVTGTRTEVGTSPNTFTFDPVNNTDMNNYKVHVTYGTLTVGSLHGTAPSDIDGNGISDILLRYVAYDGSVGYWMNGTDTWNYKSNQPYSESYNVIGMVDMNADGKADSVTIRMNGETLLAGYFSAGDTEGWVTIQELDAEEGVTWENAVGNLTGTYGKNSLLWHTPEKGALGAWLEGTSEWVRAVGSYGAEWNLIGAADLDGDGKDNALLTCDNKLYEVDIVGQTEVEFVAELDSWQVSAIGDFDSDDADELVLTKNNTVMVFDKGNVGAEWTILCDLPGTNWQIVGAGDYNGDGFDDILLHEDEGTVGCWFSADYTQWKTIGTGIDSSWTILA